MFHHDAEELFYYTLGKTEQEVEDAINTHEIDIDEAVYNKFEIDFTTYCEIVRSLLPFTPRIKTAVTGTLMNAFLRTDGRGQVAIVQQVAKG